MTVGQSLGLELRRPADPNRAAISGGTPTMWKPIGWLSLTCGIFIGMLITLSLIGLKT
jgi:hypothetical protein